MKKLLAIVWVALLPAGFPVAQSNERASAAVHFTTVDIYLDSKEEVLAAYQFEWNSESADVKIVGIQGGENANFREPPYYDPKAIQQDRVILAAFSTAGAETLPKGKTRVATIHLQVVGNEALEARIKNAKAAAPDGKSIVVEAHSLQRINVFE